MLGLIFTFGNDHTDQRIYKPNSKIYGQHKVSLVKKSPLVIILLLAQTKINRRKLKRLNLKMQLLNQKNSFKLKNNTKKIYRQSIKQKNRNISIFQ